jgi:hypothetical protein
MGTLKRRRRSAGMAIGGVLAGFDQQVFRTLPPGEELVRHARPDDPIPCGDGSSFIVLPPSSGTPLAVDPRREVALREAGAFFDGAPLGLGVLERVVALLSSFDDVDLRTTRSQIAFRRARGFAWLWRPGRYLPRADVEVVLSIALARRDGSLRFKEVVEPAPSQWMHHLQVRDLRVIDDEVAAWLAEAAARAG